MMALGILQSYLDDLGHAVMARDWEAYLRGVALPFNLVTEKANLVIADEATLRDGFDDFVDMVQSQRVTDYVRLAENATLLNDDLLSGGYVTHILSNGHRVIPPYKSTITLRRKDRVWRAVAIANALQNARWPILLPQVGPGDA